MTFYCEQIKRPASHTGSRPFYLRKSRNYWRSAGVAVLAVTGAVFTALLLLL